MFALITDIVSHQIATYANSSMAQCAATIMWSLKNIMPVMYTPDGRPRDDISHINPYQYFPMDPFIKLAESGFGKEIFRRLSRVEVLSLHGLVVTIQMIYFYKVGKPTLKNDHKLTNDEIRARALKAKEIAEKAINDFIACQEELLGEANRELYPFAAKLIGSKDENKINLTDEVFNVQSGFEMLQHLAKISPESMTKNIKKILTYLAKYSEIWEKICTDRDLMYKAHKIAARDLSKLMGNAWDLDPENVQRVTTDAFESIESNIKAREAEIGIIEI